MAKEEADERVAALGIDGWDEHVAAFDETAWQAKAKAYEVLAEHVTAQGDSLPAGTVDAVFGFTAARSRNFSDSNFNLAIASLAVARALATSSSSGGAEFTAGHAALVVSSVAIKFGDRKLNDAVIQTLDCFCEALNPRVVIGCVLPAMADVKSPAALTACFGCVSD